MLTYKTGTESINWTLLVDLYFATDGVIGLGKARNEEKIKEAFLNTYKVITVWDEGKIIGSGRMISDGVCYGWFHDVAVHPDYQNQGVGKGLMLELIKGDENLLMGLTSAFGVEDFYYNLGFRKHKTAMAKYPGNSIYLED